jgi:hypothetical protein
MTMKAATIIKDRKNTGNNDEPPGLFHHAIITISQPDLTYIHTHAHTHTTGRV